MPDGTLNRVWGAGGHGRASGGLCGGRRFGVVADAVPRSVARGSPGRSPLTPAVLDPDTVEAVLRALTETEHAELLIRRHPRSPNRRLNWSNSTDPTTDHRPADTVTSSHRRAERGRRHDAASGLEDTRSPTRVRWTSILFGLATVASSFRINRAYIATQLVAADGAHNVEYVAKTTLSVLAALVCLTAATLPAVSVDRHASGQHEPTLGTAKRWRWV